MKSLNRRLKQINTSIKKLNKPLKRRLHHHKKSQPTPVLPVTFPGEIVLFKASISLPVSEKEDYGWSRYSQKEVKVSEIKGEHGNLIKEPGAKIIAKELEQYIDDFLARETHEPRGAKIKMETGGMPALMGWGRRPILTKGKIYLKIGSNRNIL
jgi:thioesterase domain-containing protein